MAVELTDEIIAEIDVQQLPYPYSRMAPKIGLRAAMETAQMFGGTHQYFPKLESALRSARDKLIRKEFTGTNYKELALKYGLTEMWIREIVDREPDGNQLTFDDLTEQS